MKKLFALAAVAAFSTGTAQAADIVTNGGFEAPDVSDPCCTTTPPTALPGWTVTSGNVNVVNGTFASSPSGTNLAHGGDQYLDLVGQGGVGSMYQDLATVAGQVYNFSFWYSHNLFSGLGSASAAFDVGNLAGGVTHSTGSNANLDWRQYTGSFTADSASTRLTFTNLAGAGNEGVFLDDVSVSAVPEPATWALMILGFGLVGASLRSARRQNARIRFA